LVGLAAVVVFAAALAGSSHHDRSYVVAARPLAAGSVLAPGDLDSARMQLPSSAGGQAFGDSAALIGRVLAVPMQPGELLQSSMLAPASAQPAMRPVSVAVDANSIGALTAGQKVVVLATIGTGAGAQVSVVMRGAELLDVGHTGSGVFSGPANSVVVTLGVSSLAEVEAVVQAGQAGTITLAAAEASDGVGPGSGT
jgi:Flp pilus assembly protein CpaB